MLTKVIAYTDDIASTSARELRDAINAAGFAVEDVRVRPNDERVVLTPADIAY